MTLFSSQRTLKQTHKNIDSNGDTLLQPTDTETNPQEPLVSYFGQLTIIRRRSDLLHQHRARRKEVIQGWKEKARKKVFCIKPMPSWLGTENVEKICKYLNRSERKKEREAEAQWGDKMSEYIDD